MRYISNEYFSLTYPDKIAFVFLPISFRVSKNGSNIPKSMEVTLEDRASGKQAVVEIECAQDGTGIVDMREYVRDMFNPVNMADVDYEGGEQDAGTGIFLDVSITITMKDGQTFVPVDYQQDACICAVYGAPKIDGKDTFNYGQHFKYWRGYPYSIGLYNWDLQSATYPSYIAFLQNNNFVGVGFDITRAGMLNQPILYDTFNGIRGTLTIAFEEINYGTTFDKQYGYATMKNLGCIANPNDHFATMEIEECAPKDPVYLRYLDRFGFLRYWLFERGDVSINVECVTSYNRNNFMMVDSNGRGLFGGHNSYERKDVVPLCANNLTREQWQTLADIHTSPFVEMLADKTDEQWLEVTIAPGSYTCDRKKERQEMIVNMILPKFNGQTI